MAADWLTKRTGELYTSYNTSPITGILKPIDLRLTMISAGDDVRKCWGEDDPATSFRLWT